ncbi:hypothetical protein [Rhizobium sp. X9]|uniref:hypothetical protein n=1 Tax=Rhizobium sp. X9 TaxID=2815360 RepID=UPI001C0B494C|nr:hypothetical protein [Rhizobium sp. X9]
MPDRHSQVVDAIVNTPVEVLERGAIAILQNLADKFPDLSRDEFTNAMDEAMSVFEERMEKASAEITSMEQLAPLFDGLPEGTPLEECARIKGERGDPLALAFLKWMAQQAGGVQ